MVSISSFSSLLLFYHLVYTLLVFGGYLVFASAACLDWHLDGSSEWTAFDVRVPPPVACRWAVPRRSCWQWTVRHAEGAMWIPPPSPSLERKYIGVCSISIQTRCSYWPTAHSMQRRSTGIDPPWEYCRYMYISIFIASYFYTSFDAMSDV